MAPRVLTTADPVEEQQDLDPNAWLARDESDVVGHVSVRGGRLKVGALTQGEMELLRTKASRPNPQQRGGERIMDTGLLNRWVIAYALFKGNHPEAPSVEILAQAEDQVNKLKTKLTGELTEIARRILALSGFKEDGERDEDLPSVLPS